MLLFAFFACTPVEEPADSGLPAGDTGLGGSGMPSYCAESERAPVDDATVPAGSLDFAAGDVVSAAVGGWPGTFTPTTGEAVAVTLSFAYEDGTIELVSREWVDGGGGDSGPGTGGADEPCHPFYAIALFGGLATSDGLLDEHFELSLEAQALDALSFLVTIPLANVGGTTRPTSFDPGDWDAVNLALDGRGTGVAWGGSVLWQGSSGSAAAEEEEGGGGTAELSGVTEGVGSYAAARE